MVLPPRDRYLGFQEANFCSTLSTTGFHNDFGTLPTAKGNPRYVLGRDPTVQPMTSASN